MQLAYGCIIAAIVALLDPFVTVLAIGFCVSPFQFANVHTEFVNLFTGKYDFFTNPLDFLLLATIRSIALIAAAFIRYLHPVTGVDELTKLSNVVSCSAWLMYAFSPTKLLAFAERVDAPPIGAYLCVVWNLIAAFLLNMVWKHALMTVASSSSIVDEQQTSLLGASSIDDDEETTEDDDRTMIDDDTKSSTTTSADVIDVRQTFELIGRLLEYCKREWLWHLSGFSWLLLYSLSKFVYSVFHVSAGNRTRDLEILNTVRIAKPKPVRLPANIEHTE